MDGESEAGCKSVMAKKTTEVEKQNEEMEGLRWTREFDRGGKSREKMAHRGSDGEMESVRTTRKQHLY